MKINYYQVNIDRQSLITHQTDKTECNCLNMAEKMDNKFFLPIIDIFAELFKQNTDLP